MVQIIEAVYSNGKVLAENIEIPDNSKVLIIWEQSGSIAKSNRETKKTFPSGIVLNKIEGQINSLASFPENAVEYQRTQRDAEWN